MEVGIWYSMKRSIRVSVSWISLVSAPGSRLRTFSTCGLSWTTSTAKRVEASCICRNASQKARCSGESDSMASANSLGVGMGSRRSGMITSSLFLTTTACSGANSSGPTSVPTMTRKDENCRARAVSSSGAGAPRAKVRATYACAHFSPSKRKVVAPCAKRISERVSTRRHIVRAVSLFPRTARRSSPSGKLSAERRTAKANCDGLNSGANKRRSW
mmetsp:Transcript_21314/g.66856  ORF Transcript_21314/g.66856 Transcript_21314/m.66856 type:complete len:216 (-) Transcript_21314:1223-1870(-)